MIIAILVEIIGIFFSLLPWGPVWMAECDRTFVSAGEGSRNGTFTSPTFENRMGHVRQCLYTFVAAPGERVHLTFQVFALRGMPPE